MNLLLVSTLILLLLCLYFVQNKPVDKPVEPYYRRLNGKGESSYKCKSCVQGNDFDYIAQKKERKYGVPLGCQRMF
jgi:hypothetical protein